MGCLMDLLLFNPKVETNSQVSYRTLGPADAILAERPNDACFSSITYGLLPTDARKILIYRPLAQIPYALPTIRRWIKELNALGFPCRARKAKEPNVMHFIIDLKHYVHKLHINSTLQLIRCLFERGICYVPEYYFADSQDDRFLALQQAHYSLAANTANFGDYPGNSNHTVTWNGAKPVTKDQLFARIAATKIGTYEKANYGRPYLSAVWNGAKPEVQMQGLGAI